MIKLKRISRNNEKICCDAYVEDCPVPISLSLDEKNGLLEKYELPKGYEWCKSHIAHARKYMESLIGKEIETDERLIMWC